MPSQKNLASVTTLKDKLSRSKSVVFADHSGLSVADQTQLRSDVAAAGGEFTVAKNTLLKLALATANLSPDIAAVLQGPTAVMFSYDDAVAAIKALVKFAQTKDLPTIKLGLLEDRLLSIAEVKQLASLPTQTELIAQLIGQIQAPTSGLVNVLQGNLKKLIFVLKAISDQAGNSENQKVS